MTAIKVCGIRRSKDVDYLNELYPDYAGFIFCKSKRQVSLEEAERLIEKLDNKISTVGVFQNQDLETVKSMVSQLKLDIIQLHGNEDEAFIKELSSFRLWKSVSFKKLEVVDKVQEVSSYNNLGNDTKERLIDYQRRIETLCGLNIEAILVDSSFKGAAGGTGMSFNWNILKNFNIEKSLVLAGGLYVDNVSEAIKLVKPSIVDVSSGVETDGIKDFKKMKNFITKVRQL